MKAPREGRLTWSCAGEAVASSSPQADLNDIYFIEAVGPAIALHMYGNILRNCLWTHYIDNEAAEAALVKGSSTVLAGDIVTGWTWEAVARARVRPWFDRVSSSANPVDGLSRGSMVGPWRVVEKGCLPPALVSRLRKQLYGRQARRP